METDPQSKILRIESRPKLDFSHLRMLGSLPDNVFMLRPDDEPPEPPQAEALAA